MPMGGVSRAKQIFGHWQVQFLTERKKNENSYSEVNNNVKSDDAQKQGETISQESGDAEM